MAQLISFPVGIVPWVHESKETLHAIRLDPDERQQGDYQKTNQPGEQLQVYSSQEQYRHHDGGNNDECAEIRLEQQQRTYNERHDQHGQKTFTKTPEVNRLANGIVGDIKHHEQLHELRWLKIHDHQRYPPPAAIDFVAYAGNQHQQQQHCSEQKQVEGIFLPHLHRHLKCD